MPIEDELESLEAITTHEVGSNVDVLARYARLACPRSRERNQYQARQILEGLSVAEASEKTGYSPSDIKISVHRALKTLQERVREAQGMKTDSLIERLTADFVVPTRPVLSAGRFSLAMILISLATIFIGLPTVRFRPDLAGKFSDFCYLADLILPSLLMVFTFVWAVRMSVPGGSPHDGCR